jgi:hypothetical protein
MKYGIYNSYWEQEWSADCLKYVEKVAKLGFDVIEIAAHHLKQLQPGAHRRRRSFCPRPRDHNYRRARSVPAEEPILR